MPGPLPLPSIAYPAWLRVPLAPDPPAGKGGPPSPTPSAGAGAAKPLADLTSLPATPADAPAKISVPAALDAKFDELWGKSFPGGRSQEFGGTLVRDKKSGELSLVNIGGGSSGAFTAVDRNVAAGKEIVGIFHTHPYSRAEGGYTNVSLSGGDVAYAALNKDPVIIAQSGQGQFMVVRTAETPTTVDFDKINDKGNDRVAELMRGGKGYEEATRIAAKEAAVSLKMAYYEGKDGEFKRVSP
jgi:type VI secretion system secreted protein VgrG